ncbi:metallophosphoesterase family protein, partial [Elusimicrobiota bacterium]
MLYGVISDIHGNYDALSVALKFLENKKVDAIINCGDIVGYGPDPNKCIEAVRKQKNLYSVMGNHDWAVINNEDSKWFNPIAKKAIEWSRETILSRNYDYLSEFVTTKSIGNFMFLHGSPRNPLNEYLLDISEVLPNFMVMFHKICFIGHTHTPACYKCNIDNKVEKVHLKDGEQILLEPGSRYIFNVGSVGQPRDEDSRMSVCIYNNNDISVSYRRLEYNIPKVQEKINAAQLDTPSL